MHKTMLAHNRILVYEGEFSQEIMKSVLAMAERNMEAIGEHSSVRKKVFNVIVECLQNIIKHSENNPEKTDKDRQSIFMICKTKEDFIITSGNPITSKIEELLKIKLAAINKLDQNGLKKLYKDTIQDGDLSEKGGAGLGFIDIARRSGKKLDYMFEKINEQQSFFTIKTHISRI